MGQNLPLKAQPISMGLPHGSLCWSQGHPWLVASEPLKPVSTWHQASVSAIKATARIQRHRFGAGRPRLPHAMSWADTPGWRGLRRGPQMAVSVSRGDDGTRGARPGSEFPCLPHVQKAGSKLQTSYPRAKEATCRSGCSQLRAQSPSKLKATRQKRGLPCTTDACCLKAAGSAL